VQPSTRAPTREKIGSVTGQGGAGRCLCGAVSFRVRRGLRGVIDCHCERCRRFTGHHMAATSAAVADVDVTDPEQLLTWYYPVPEAGYAFCGRCGSSLFWQGADHPERLSVCAGTLDQPTGLRTVAAWWVSQAGDYHTRPDLPEHATEP
jgi:hypothetical protein